MPLESVANILDGDTHVLLDAVVLNTCEGHIEPSKLGTVAAMFLLSTVVSNSGGTLDPKYENAVNAMTLLQEEEEELLEKLNNAWTKKKFEEICNLSAIDVFFNAAS
jgi:hypothetical protein